MATQLICTACGKLSRSKIDIPAGKSVRCPKCGESFRVPDETVQLKNDPFMFPDLSHAVESVATPPNPIDRVDLNIDVKVPRKFSLRKTKPRTPMTSGRMTTIVAILFFIVITFGSGLSIGKRIGQPSIDKARLDRMSNVFRVASNSWSESENEITDACLDASRYMISKEKFVDPSTVAYLLSRCGRVERYWRGVEKCQGMSFVVSLFTEMIVEGTPEEDAIRMLVKIHAMKTGARKGITPFECDQIRRIVDQQLMMGSFPTRTMAYENFLKTVNGLEGK